MEVALPKTTLILRLLRGNCFHRNPHSHLGDFNVGSTSLRYSSSLSWLVQFEHNIEICAQTVILLCERPLRLLEYKNTATTQGIHKNTRSAGTNCRQKEEHRNTTVIKPRSQSNCTRTCWGTLGSSKDHLGDNLVLVWNRFGGNLESNCDRLKLCCHHFCKFSDILGTLRPLRCLVRL